MKKRMVSVLLTACMMGTLLTGCGGNGESTGETSANAAGETGGTGDEEIVTLKWYMSLPNVATDTDQVIEALNEYTREKIGVEIEYMPMADSEYMEKMPTYINSGEDFDICFTADWSTDYLQFAQRDAFLDISELLPEYGKETWELIPEQLWKAVTVNGAIYGVPSYKEMGRQGGIYVNSEMAEA